MPNVAFRHKLLSALLPQYELIRDAIAGERQVKFRKELYLPRPNPEDVTPANARRYDAYLKRAVFYNVAQRTLFGLRGQVFLREPNVEVPEVLQPVIEDATGEGVPLMQLAQEATDFALGYGRFGLLVDYPNTVDDDGEQVAASKAEVDAGDVRPTFRLYAPWQCLNWRVIRRGAKIILSLVVLEEEYSIEDDGFETKTGKQWRVLRLIDGRYVVEIYKDRSGSNKPDETFQPIDGTGAPITEIPFTFGGSVKNVATPNAPPLYDLCSLNMAHYRNSADYEENIYEIGQPTPYFAGLTEEWVKNVMGGTVRLGARGSIPLPQGGTAGLLQVLPNTLAKEGMDQKEGQMLALGAKLVEASQTQRTATEADIDNVSETSVLSSVASNVGAAFKWALEWACVFVGVPENVKYDMNTEFDLVNLTPDERRQLLAEWQAGGIVFEEYRDNLRRAGIATLSDAEAKTKAANEDAERLAKSVEMATALASANPDKPPVAE